MAHPHSGTKPYKSVFNSVSSAGSSLPTVLIFYNNFELLALK